MNRFLRPEETTISEWIEAKGVGGRFLFLRLVLLAPNGHKTLWEVHRKFPVSPQQREEMRAALDDYTHPDCTCGLSGAGTNFDCIRHKGEAPQ